MAGLWQIVIPEATTNLCTNPSFETGTTGWATAATIAQSATYAKFGVYSLRFTPAAGTTSFLYYDFTATSDQTYTAQAWVRGAAGIPYRIYIGKQSDDSVIGSATTFTGTGAWQFVEVTQNVGANTAVRLIIGKNTHASTDYVYIDAVQLEQKAYSTTYIDGDQAGGVWSGTQHGSTTTRAASERGGGHKYNLDDYGFYIEEIGGVGMPPISNRYQEYSSLHGGEWQALKIRPRQFILAGQMIGTSLADLHSKRKDLIDAIKPNLVRGSQPFRVYYTGANSAAPVFINCRYDDGLSFGDMRGYSENIAVRLLAVDPFWYEDGQGGAVLTASGAISNADYIIAKISGVWSALGTGTNGQVMAIVRDYIRNVTYVGGNFTTAGGTTVNYVAKWTAGVWAILDDTLNGTVHALVVDAAGNLYAGGEFTNASGVANADRLAKWTGAAWTALGTGADNGVIYALAIDSLGNVWAGGSSNNIGGVAAADKIGYWNGSTWNALGTGANDTVYALEHNPITKTLYIGGVFTAIDGDTHNRVASKPDGSSEIETLDDGLSTGTVYALTSAPNGYVWAGGSMTTELYMAQWDGGKWTYPGETNADLDTVDALEYGGGLVYVGDESGVIYTWNGYAWAREDLILSGSPPIISELYYNTVTGNLYVGMSTTGVTAGGSNTVTNSGTMSAYPRITIKRSGGTSATLEFLRNETTGQTIYFDYSLLDGEVLTIDLSIDRRTVTSSVFGDVLGSAILRRSDFASFRVLPGANIITLSAAVAGSPTMTNLITFPITHYSIDGSAA